MKRRQAIIQKDRQLESPGLRVNFQQLFSHSFVCCWKKNLEIGETIWRYKVRTENRFRVSIHRKRKHVLCWNTVVVQTSPGQPGSLKTSWHHLLTLFTSVLALITTAMSRNALSVLAWWSQGRPTLVLSWSQSELRQPGTPWWHLKLLLTGSLPNLESTRWA